MKLKQSTSKLALFIYESARTLVDRVRFGIEVQLVSKPTLSEYLRVIPQRREDRAT